MLEITESNPNIKVSRFLKCVQSEKSQKNIVLLLVKLAEHADISSDLSIPLKYYLDMYEEFPEEPSFSEAGILLISSAVIYAKRVDSVHLNVERLIFSLLHAEQNQSQGCIASPPPQTIKKAKKRTLEKSNGRYGADMNIKRFKIISAYKRLDNSLNIVKSSKLSCSPSLDKNCIHPTIWKYSVIEDYEYGDEIDSKKNYKLFNYHLEHRYNTLIPDINFKMYFKIKDFIIDKEREPWPPLSIAYIEQYVNLENIILRTEARNASIDNRQIRKDNLIETTDKEEMHTLSNITKQLQMKNYISALSHNYLSDKNINGNNKNDYLSFDNMNLDISSENLKNRTTIQATIDKERNNNCNEENFNLCPFENNTFDKLSTREASTDIENCNSLRNTVQCMRDNLTTHSKSNEDLTTVKVILPHLDDEGVFFLDLDEHDQQMLSPSVVATDVFRCVKNKQNIVVVVDDVIKNIYNIREPRHRLSLPVFCSSDHPILPINLFKIHNKYFRKRRTFKLCSEFNPLKKERLKKNCGDTKNSTCIRTHVCLSEDVVGVHHSPLTSPSYEPDFCGFSDDVSYDKNRTLSRDSGISVFQAKILSNQEINKADHFNSNNYLTQEPGDNTSNTNNYSFSKTSIINAGIINNGKIATVASKVQEWHTHLQPILAKSRERHHFDVLELGTEIIRKFETYNTGSEIISLNDVMEKKDSSLISRYFLSSLLLANHGNITINIRRKCTENPSELIDVELQLLDKRRNFTCLNENIELSTSEVAEEIQIAASTFKNFRILKPIPKTSKREDHDSGISISDGCSL